MTTKFLNRSFFQRIFGLPATPKPIDPQCWTFSAGKITIDLKRATEIKKLGGAQRLEGDGLPMRVLVIRGDDGAFYAFHNRCTHIGRRRLDPVLGKSPIPTTAERSKDRLPDLSALVRSKQLESGCSCIRTS